ncbi:MAG: GNAT family N-acetyltransferase [Hyphomonadaceae bacterium]
MSAIPTVETERLRLRGHTRADFEACVAMWADPAVTRFIGGRPSTREESWARLLRYPGHWALMGYGYWVIEEKATGRYLGEGGFADLQREIDPPVDPPEQGWALVSDAHGKGFALEAASAMIRWGEAHFGHGDFTCMISPENEPSLRLAAKLGYREFARTTFKGAATALFRRS